MTSFDIVIKFDGKWYGSNYGSLEVFSSSRPLQEKPSIGNPGDSSSVKTRLGSPNSHRGVEDPPRNLPIQHSGGSSIGV